MINYIWGGLMLISLVTAFFTGKLEVVTNAAMEGASDAVTMSLSLLGVICLWTGMMRIAQEGGLINLFARLLKPVTKFLFPRLPQNSNAIDAIVMNMIANVLGMANAATPLGLKAMKELGKLNKNNRASNEMCLFVIINTASLQLIPSTLIAMRQGSQNAFEIIVPVWIVSLSTLIVGITAANFFSLRE